MSQLEDTKQLHQQGQFEQAITGYQQVLNNDPNQDEAHFGLAHVYSQTQQLELALTHIKEAVKLSPNTDRYLQFKGQMHMANNELDDALKAFTRSLKENPNLFFSYLAIGDIHAIKNQSSKAKHNYKLALKVNREGIPAIVKLSRLLMLEGDYAGAQDELQQAELMFPEEPNLKLQMGIMKLEQGEDGFAELYFKKILETEPQNLVAKAYLAISLLATDLEQASDLITELTNLKAQLPELMVALGLFYASTNNHMEAIRYLQPICQSGLAYPSWMLNLAKSFAANKQVPTAIEVLQEILKRGKNTKALLMLAQIEQRHGDYKKAIKTLQQIDANSSEYLRAQLVLAECHYKLGAFDFCIKALEPLFEHHAEHNDALKIKINALSQMYQVDEALAVIDGIESDNHVDEFKQLMHFYKGMLHNEKKEFETAWDSFSKLQHPDLIQIDLLNDNDEKLVQSFPHQPANSVFNFVFSDPATGHHDFLQWLLQNNITPLLDRYTATSRQDVFTQPWTARDLEGVSDTQAHLWRKKYTKQLRQVIDDGTSAVADFLSYHPINVAVIKKIFPQANVLVLTRNFADIRLHNRVFGQYQVHYREFSKITNQMVAMNPNVALLNVDEWQQHEDQAEAIIKRIFGDQVKPFEATNITPLDQLMLPYMHWKNYPQLNQ